MDIKELESSFDSSRGISPQPFSSNFPWTETALDEAYRQSMAEELEDFMDTNSSSSTVPPKKPQRHLKVGRRPKKRKGMPRRSLTAYNLFFRDVRSELLTQTGHVAFEEMGKIVGKRWQVIPEEERKKYIELAKKDTIRYQKEMKVFEENRKKENEKRAAAAVDTLPYPPSPTAPRVGIEALLPGHLHLHPLPREWLDQKISDTTEPLPITPGAVVSVAQPDGSQQKFKVDYKFVKMRQSEATKFIADLHCQARTIS